MCPPPATLRIAAALLVLGTACAPETDLNAIPEPPPPPLRVELASVPTEDGVFAHPELFGEPIIDTFDLIEGNVPLGVSDDGGVVATAIAPGPNVLRWTPEGGQEWFADTGSSSNIMMGLSGDGTTVIGQEGVWTTGDTSAAIYNHSNGWTRLGVLGDGTCPTRGTGYDLTPDASIAVGLAWVDGCSARAFRWTAATGMEALPLLGISGNRASAVSDDGGVTVGFARTEDTNRSPAVWFDDGSAELPMGNAGGEFHAVSADGTWSVGELAGEAIRWNPTHGKEFLGRLGNPPSSSDKSAALGICGDWIVGYSGKPATKTDAFIWREDVGMLDFQDVIEDVLEIDIPSGVKLSMATHCSPDGRNFIGLADSADGGRQTWVLHLTPWAWDALE